MNRGAIAVIALAIGAVILIGLYAIYKNNINAAADEVFSKVQDFVEQANWNTDAILPAVKSAFVGLV